MPLFEDYDRVHIGSVTRSQFHRVLSELELGGKSLQPKFSVTVANTPTCHAPK